MIYNAIGSELKEGVRPIFIERPCVYCGEPTDCSCGCCHGPECQVKRWEEDTRKIKELFDYPKSS